MNPSGFITSRLNSTSTLCLKKPETHNGSSRCAQRVQQSFFFYRLILQTPVVLDVDIVTTLGEKESEILRKMVIATMYMYSVIIFKKE